MGLGSLNAVSLSEAREKAAECRKLRDQGKDPIDTRSAKRAAAAAERVKAMTFDQCAERYIAAHRAGWRNPRHAAQWQNTLVTYVSPAFGRLPAQSIDVGLVTKVLEPIWSTKPETASRVRGRIERFLIGRRPAASATRTIQHAGRVASTSCSRALPRCVQSGITLLFPILRLVASLACSGIAPPRPPELWNSPF